MNQKARKFLLLIRRILMVFVRARVAEMSEINDGAPL